MSSVLTWDTFVVTNTVVSSARGGDFLQVYVSATGLKLDGSSIVMGFPEDNLYVFYTDPTTNTNTTQRVNLTSEGTLNNQRIDLPNGQYAAGSVKIAYSTDAINMSSNAFTLPTLPLGTTSNMSATIIPVPLDDGRYLLSIADVSISGSPVSSAILIINEVNSNQSVTFSYTGNSTYGPYNLDYSRYYLQTTSGDRIEFTTDETYQSFTVSGVTDTGATLTYTVPAGQTPVLTNNDQDITSYTDGPIVLKLYQGSTLVDSIQWDATPSVFTLTGLTAGTSYTYRLKYSDTLTIPSAGGTSTTYNVLTDGKTVTFTTTGGGGGGGGGNNGGNGYNNMALEFSYDGYTGSVTQTNTITVLGEEGGALPTAYDTLVVHVTPAELSQALAYKGTWTDTSGEEAGEQPRPDVKFLPALACGTKLTAAYDLLKTKGSGPEDSDDRKWKDSNGDKKERFGNIMLGVGFTNSWLDDDELPREAIRKIEEGELSVPDHFATQDADSVVKDLTSTATGAPKALLEGLFEQAVAAGKILGDAVAGNNQGSPAHADATLAAAGWKQAVFAEDDSISFLVKFSFTKTRDYVIDSEETGDSSGNTKTTSKTIVVGGTSYEIVATNEVSNTEDKLYIVKMLAKASPVEPDVAA